jgi:NAD(P)-dependent dehydrogenase (short-subunit alcohol dehydrogenase family)
MPTLRNQRALITGATRGIGLAIARALGEEGCNLILTGRSESALDKARRELEPLGVQIQVEPCDISNAADVNRLFRSIGNQPLDILINNAGISHAMAPVHELDPKIWEDVIATDLTGMFLVIRASLPLMKQGSAIVNNLSIAAKTVFPGQAAYCAAKHGALALTTSLREELRPKGIRVIALLPGATDTDIWTQFWPDAPREKMLKPEAVAQAVVDALLLPPESTAEELVLTPTAGKL